MHIYKFNSILKPVLWGGDKLVRFKGLPACDAPIGESWELSALPEHESVVSEGSEKGLTLTRLVQQYGDELLGRGFHSRFGDTFPLLIKLIDAERDLSIQVHPGDEMAMRVHGCKGKNEMWYVLQSNSDSKIRAGFNRPLSKDELDRRVTNGTLLEVIKEIPTKPGDCYYIPAGLIHSIGAGNLVVEIQQTSDITYRVWDYNRCDANGNRRPLHAALALQALDTTATDIGCLRPEHGADSPHTVAKLVSNPHFAVWCLDVADGMVEHLSHIMDSDSFAALVGVKGLARLDIENSASTMLDPGEVALVPAALVDKVSVKGPCRLLLTFVPNNV